MDDFCYHHARRRCESLRKLLSLQNQSEGILYHRPNEVYKAKSAPSNHEETTNQTACLSNEAHRVNSKFLDTALDKVCQLNNLEVCNADRVSPTLATNTPVDDFLPAKEEFASCEDILDTYKSLDNSSAEEESGHVQECKNTGTRKSKLHLDANLNVLNRFWEHPPHLSKESYLGMRNIEVASEDLNPPKLEYFNRISEDISKQLALLEDSDNDIQGDIVSNCPSFSSCISGKGLSSFRCSSSGGSDVISPDSGINVDDVFVMEFPWQQTEPSILELNSSDDVADQRKSMTRSPLLSLYHSSNPLGRHDKLQSKSTFTHTSSKDGHSLPKNPLFTTQITDKKNRRTSFGLSSRTSVPGVLFTTQSPKKPLYSMTSASVSLPMTFSSSSSSPDRKYHLREYKKPSYKHLKNFGFEGSIRDRTRRTPKSPKSGKKLERKPSLRDAKKCPEKKSPVFKGKRISKYATKPKDSSGVDMNTSSTVTHGMCGDYSVQYPTNHTMFFDSSTAKINASLKEKIFSSRHQEISPSLCESLPYLNPLRASYITAWTEAGKKEEFQVKTEMHEEKEEQMSDSNQPLDLRTVIREGNDSTIKTQGASVIGHYDGTEQKNRLKLTAPDIKNVAHVKNEKSNLINPYKGKNVAHVRKDKLYNNVALDSKALAHFQNYKRQSFVPHNKDLAQLQKHGTFLPTCTDQGQQSKVGVVATLSGIAALNPYTSYLDPFDASVRAADKNITTKFHLSVSAANTSLSNQLNASVAIQDKNITNQLDASLNAADKEVTYQSDVSASAADNLGNQFHTSVSALDNNATKQKPKKPPRRRGRPPGSKNKFLIAFAKELRKIEKTWKKERKRERKKRRKQRKLQKMEEEESTNEEDSTQIDESPANTVIEVPPDPPPELKQFVISTSTFGETTLHKAARLKKVELARYCLEYSLTDVNAKDNAGYTPLHECCVQGDLEIATLLLSYGADPNSPALDGTRPIHDAVMNNRLHLTRLLLSYGADPLLKTYAGYSAASLAFNKKQINDLITGYLSDIQGSVHSNGPGQNLLRISASAMYKKDLELTEYLKYTEYSKTSDGDDKVVANSDDDDVAVTFALSDEPMLPTYPIHLAEDKVEYQWLLLADILKQVKMRRCKFFSRYPEVTIVRMSLEQFLEQLNLCQIATPPKNLFSYSDYYRGVEVVALDGVLQSILKIEEVKI